MSSSKSVIVVAPGCPSELIQELLSRILPVLADVVVLLPPGNNPQYDHLIEKNHPLGRTRFFSSPAKRFFSPRHLKWLWNNLRSSKDNLLLIIKTPYQDPTTAMISLTVLMLSGKGITLLFPTPEAALDLNGQGFSERWITQKLNYEILFKEVFRVFWFLNPWSILYLFMLVGLIVRSKLSEFLASKTKPEFVHKEKSDERST